MVGAYHDDHWTNLTRAYKTSEMISAALGIDSITTDERLREINCGLIEGTTEEERILQWGEEWRLKDIGMEPYDEVAMRGIEFLYEISIQHPDQYVLIVSHGALIGLTLQRLLPEFFTKTYIDNAALTVIERNRDNIWQCNLYNCTKHLGSR
ncbi:histidine phosphatase family protein [Paenibacillus sp. EC2-1]|uniref:histidine phosphatase family protein n=1 Tax=Paenibacillus sp. EC2-1 TaxID=3388665 RepID=UPI003BEF07E7